MTTTDQHNVEMKQGTAAIAAREYKQAEAERAIAEQGIEVDPILPLNLCGPEISYFTGKLEAVIRYMELPYQRVVKGPMEVMADLTGTAQVPGLQLADGRWMTDSTPIIAWLDQRYPEVSVIPRDPVTAFFSRLLDEEWVYRMTHPAFEDTNLGYGYLTWVKSTPSALPDIDPNVGVPLRQCSPPAIWREFPHTLSESIDCNYDDPQACVQTYDVGAFSALGLGGQVIEGHPGLDLVLVARNSAGAASGPWDMIRPALVEHDPGYAGDEAAFCEAYRAADYAPDMITLP